MNDERVRHEDHRGPQNRNQWLMKQICHSLDCTRHQSACFLRLNCLHQSCLHESCLH